MMKQSKLDFSSVKRTGSGNMGKPKATSSQTVPSSRDVPSTNSKAIKEDKTYEDIVLVNDKEDDSADESVGSDATSDASVKPDDKATVTPSAGRTTRSSTKKTTTAPKKVAAESSTEAKASVFRPSNAKTEDVVKKVEANAQKEDAPELPELNVKDPKYKRHYAEVKEKMGGLPAIHGEKQNRIHEILRIFDNSYEYGPCVGISRRDRWDRAQTLGLNPPMEVDDILKTKEGSTKPEYTESVFYGQV